MSENSRINTRYGSMTHGGQQVEPPEWLPSEPARHRFEYGIATDITAPPEGKVQFAQPKAMTGQMTANFTIPRRETTLTVDPALNVAPADVGLFASRRHDGTHLATYELISDITQAAEAEVAERGGTWVASQVAVLSKYVYADGAVLEHDDPPRKGTAPIYQEDWVSIRLRKAEPRSSEAAQVVR